MSVQYFLDTASIKDIRKWYDLGLVNGVTTNPVLLTQNSISDVSDFIYTLNKIDVFPVSIPLLQSLPEKMIEEGMRLSSIAENVVIKIPATEYGYCVARELIKEKIKCNITFVFDPATAIPFLNIEPEYLSVIIDRNEDFGAAPLDDKESPLTIVDLP